MTFSTLDDIREKRNGTKNSDFNIDNLFLGSFHLCFPHTYNLIDKIVNNFISGINSKYYFNMKSNRNNKLVGNAIRDLFTLKIYRIIEKEGFQISDYFSIRSDEKLNGYIGLLQQYEKAPESLEKMYEHILTDSLQEYLLLIKIYSILLVNEQSKKDLMKELGIYEPYKSQGNKYKEEREIIYRFIPAVKDILLKENNGEHQRGKTGTKAAVREAIKILEKRKLITRNKHDHDKIYNGFLKYNDPHKPYERLIRKKSKEFNKKAK